VPLWPERRPTLTASARAGVGNLRSGRKKACGAVEQKKAQKQRKKGLDSAPAHIIPIAPDAPPRHVFRGFLLWRFAYAGPRGAPRHLHRAGIRKPSQKRSVVENGFSTQAGLPTPPGAIHPWRHRPRDRIPGRYARRHNGKTMNGAAKDEFELAPSLTVS
jgi:hypothetical protein